METNTDAAEPTPPPIPEEPQGLEVEATPIAPAVEGPDELDQIILATQKGRLSTPEEDRATELLKEALLGGRGGVARAVLALPQLPWLVGVRAVETVWPELTAGFRTQLLSGLAKEETEAARRSRLSLARALYKIEPPVGLKIAIGVARDVLDKESDGLGPRDAQLISNVFIGRARPWVAQLPLAELKPADADLLVHVAVLATFSLPHPPLTQLGILKWAQENDRLDKLRENALEAVKKGLGRLSAKWQNAVRTEVAGLPEAIAAALVKPAESSEPAEPASDDAPGSEAAEHGSEGESGNGEAAETPPPRKERPVYVSREEEARRKAIAEGTLDPNATESSDIAAAAADDEDEDDREDDEDEEAPASREPKDFREQREQREPREPREQRQGRGQQFNVTQALRQIESHVNSLRSELESMRSKLRNRESESARSKRKPDVPVIEGEPTMEELARLNRQLELRNAELQMRIDELLQNAEDAAAAAGAHTGEPVTDPDAQLRALLALKFQEDFDDFLALEQEDNDVVVQQHYRTIIRHLFEVLTEQGVPLRKG